MGAASLLGVESQGGSEAGLEVLGKGVGGEQSFTLIQETHHVVQAWCGGRRKWHTQIFSYAKDVLIHAFLYVEILPLITAPDKERMELLPTYLRSLDFPDILGTVLFAIRIP